MTGADLGARGAREAVRRRVEDSFLGRCLDSFLAVEGVDRALVLASQAFTALVPLLILVSALAPGGDGTAVADALVARFRLEGSAASDVEQLFATSGEGSIGLLSAALLLFSALSLTRRLQRTYHAAWGLTRVAGVRSSLHALGGLTVLMVEITLLAVARQLVRGIPLDGLLALLLSAGAGVVLWTTVPWLLTDRRIAWRRLLPTGVLTSACASAYGAASALWMPRLIARYSERYGLFGITLALVGWLLAFCLLLVVTTVVARELDRSDRPWARRLVARLTTGRGERGRGPDRRLPSAREQPGLLRGELLVGEDAVRLELAELLELLEPVRSGGGRSGRLLRLRRVRRGRRLLVGLLALAGGLRIPLGEAGRLAALDAPAHGRGGAGDHGGPGDSSEQSGHVGVLLVRRCELVHGRDRVHDLLGRDPGAGHELAPGLAGGLDERDRPQVLVDDQRGEAARFERVRGLADVVVAEEARPSPRELPEAAELDPGPLGGEVDGVGVALGRPPEDDDVVDADDATVDELEELRGCSAGQPVALELQEDEVDRSVDRGLGHHRLASVRGAPAGPGVERTLLAGGGAVIIRRG